VRSVRDHANAQAARQAPSYVAPAGGFYVAWATAGGVPVVTRMSDTPIEPYAYEHVVFVDLELRDEDTWWQLVRAYRQGRLAVRVLETIAKRLPPP
jgi:hypothetical protein